MDADKQETTIEKYECGHCGSKSTMLICGKGKRNGSERTDFGDVDWGRTWLILLCLSCDGVNVIEESWNSEGDYDLDVHGKLNPVVAFEHLYPQKRKVFNQLPGTVAASLKVAQRLLNIEPIASAVFVGRTIEYICDDRDAKGNTLEDKIKDLSTKEGIPPRLANMAHSSRLFRNMGVHASGITEISREDATVLVYFCEAIAEYVYEAPVMLERIQKRLSELKNQESNWKSSNQKSRKKHNHWTSSA